MVMIYQSFNRMLFQLPAAAMASLRVARPCCAKILQLYAFRCGLDVPQSKAHIAEYLASGALVLQEGFNLEVSNLPTESLNDLCIALENRALAGSLSKPLFSTGAVVETESGGVGVSRSGGW
jgi:hypothetical protein